MAKQGHQQAPDPVDATDLVSKGYADTNYASNQVLAAAGGDYIQIEISSNQSYPGDNQPIDFDTVTASRGDLTVDANGRVSGFKAGRFYLVIPTVSFSATNSTRLTYNLWDVTADARLGGTNYDALTTTYSVNNSSNPTSHFPWAPTVDSELEVRTVSSTSGTPTIKTNSRLTIVEIGAVQANVVGGLEYLDTITVTGSAVQTVTFGASGDGVHQRALDGDVDEQYLLVSKIKQDTVSIIEYEVRPNGTSTNMKSTRIIGAGSTPTSDTFTKLLLARSGEQYINLETVINAKTGLHRSLVTTGGHSESSVTIRTTLVHSYWEETTTNITSLEVRADTADGFAVGSELVLYRRTSNNLRADSADSYERHITAAADEGTSSETVTLGRPNYGGSAIAINIQADDATTAGTLVASLKVDGVTKLTATLDTTNTTYHRDAEQIGVHTFNPSDEITVELVGDSSYTNAAGGVTGVTINVTLVNAALIAPPTQIGYAELFMSGQQTTNISVDNHLEFDTITSRGNLFSLATGAGQADGLLTIQPGTYEIEMLVRFEGNGNDSVTLILRDDSDDSTVLSDAGRQLRILTASSNLATGWSPINTNKGIVTFENEITVKLDITGISGTLVSLRSDSWIIIKELR